MGKRTGKIGSKKILFGEITEARAEMLEAVDVVQKYRPELEGFAPITDLFQICSQTNIGAVRCMADRLMKLGYLVKQVPNDRSAEYSLTDKGRESLVRIGQIKEPASAKVDAPEEPVTPNKPEPVIPDKVQTIIDSLVGVGEKIEKLSEVIPTIRQIKGLYVRLESLEKKFDDITWRTGIENRGQLKTILKTQAIIAETLLDFCESTSAHVTKLANLVYDLPRPNQE
jgi:predicted transcriptional regulator